MKLWLDETSIISKYENVQLVDHSNPKIKSIGTLFLTTTSLVFINTNSKQEIWILYSLISSVEKQPINISGSPLLIKCKHFLTCMFVISKEKDCQTINTTLLQFSRPNKFKDLLCFKQKIQMRNLSSLLNSSNNENDNSENGNEKFQTITKSFKMASEYARMGVPNSRWKSTDINLNYEISNTYPSLFYVPSSATDTILKGSANFRSRGRLPVLSYLHANGASINRCSQPLSGFNGRSVEDEQLLQLILLTNENSKSMYVVDTRPKINALANKAQGKGYENENNYSNINFYFIGIENIHVMRNSLQKLIECSESSSSSSFLNSLDKCEWLKHIKAILETSVFISDAINIEKVSVLVHCSDGWDRTAQTCAIASLLLDPHYRSIHGFQTLIEKEWLMFGHKFSHRCFHLYENENSAKEFSPIFTQFLDCVWQLQQQYPCAFEFNEKFLIVLHESVHSCEFGTFIGNCEKERVELGLEETTESFWDYIQLKINHFLNPLYVPNSIYSTVLRPDCRVQSLKFWKSLYNRYDSKINPSEIKLDSLNLIKDSTISIEECSKIIERKVNKLKASINKSKQEKNNIDEKNQIEDTKTSDSKKNTNSLERSPEMISKNFLDLFLKSNSNNMDHNSLKIFSTTKNQSCNCLQFFDSASLTKSCIRCEMKCCERCEENGKYFGNQNFSKLIFICKNCLQI